MEVSRFDQFVRELLGGGTRRALLRLSAIPVTGALASLGVDDDASEAKKKRKNKKRKKRRKAKNVTVSCQEAASAEIFTGYQRAAQTFLAPRDGKITSATVHLSDNPDGFSLDFEVRAVDSDEAPGDVLGSTQASNIPATSDSDTRPVTVTFSPPVSVSGGQRYALAAVAPNPAGFLWNGNSDCPDQRSFSDEDAEEPWIEDSEYYDLVFSLTIA
jgi:hypothetical protein